MNIAGRQSAWVTFHREAIFYIGLYGMKNMRNSAAKANVLFEMTLIIQNNASTSVNAWTFASPNGDSVMPG
jgi:hypothetical protein